MSANREIFNSMQELTEYNSRLKERRDAREIEIRIEQQLNSTIVDEEKDDDRCCYCGQ